MMKLKRKLEYRGHMYFDAVRPNFLSRVLQYLREKNHLYENIEIDISNLPSDICNSIDYDKVVEFLENNTRYESLL